MQRIIITEQDLTSNADVMSSYDVAYVPGFSSLTDSDKLNSFYRRPTLFTNKYAFTSAIGTEPATFVDPQEYPRWVKDTTSGFTSKAIPSGSETAYMFEQGDADLGYRIALYLLSLGIPVYYEVMNNTNGTSGAEYSVEPIYTQVASDAVFDSTVTYYVGTATTASTLSYGGTQQQTVPTITGESFAQAVSYVPGKYTFTGSFTPTLVTADGSSFVPAFVEGTGENTCLTKIGSGAVDGTSFTFVASKSGATTTWKLNNETTVNLTEYGITVTGTVNNGDTFNVVVTSTWALNENTVLLNDYGFSEITYLGTDTYTVAVTYSAAAITSGQTSSNAVVAQIDNSSFSAGGVFFTQSENEVCPVTVKSMYAGLSARFIKTQENIETSFDTMGDYSIKYITSGGYPTFEYAASGDASAYPLMTAMIDMAATRGDAVALIDHTNNPTRDLYPTSLGGSGNSVIDIVRVVCANLDNASYGAMFTPWYSCSHAAIAGDGFSTFVPASVAFLSALAVQIRDYNPWLAVSGVTRGKVPNLVASDDTNGVHTVTLLTNNIADSYQTLPSGINEGVAQVSINPITYIRNAGYCLWGNRTLRNNATGVKSLSFLNIRGVVSDVKKVIYETAQRNLFEQNTDITWINFKSAITPLLDRMVSNYILTDYSIVRYLIDPESGDPVPSYMVLAVIKIQPINSIEVFDLTVQLENSDVTVVEIQ